MALTPVFNFTQNDGGLTGAVVNATVYGSPNQDRNEAAEVLLWSKTNKNGVRSFDNPSQGNLLTNLNYTVNTPVSGWYEGINLRMQPYDAGTNYVEEQESGGVITQYASLIYYPTTGLFYYSVAPSTGQDPTDTAYFAQITDYSTVIENPNADAYIFDVYSEYAVNNCITQKFAANCGCAPGSFQQKFIDTLYSQKVAADLAFANGNSAQMEDIIRKISESCTQC